MSNSARRIRLSGRTGTSVLPVEPLALLTILLVLSGCAASNRSVTEAPLPAIQPAKESDAASPAAVVESRLRSAYADWAGTPHSLGGTTLRGVDCSGFVQRVYASAFDLHLPRTTREQVDAGVRISRRDLRPGDLVFFKPPSRTRHVGIYLNDGEFAHASSSQGVIISELDEAYWDRAYWTSRRVLPDPSHPVRMPPAASEWDGNFTSSKPDEQQIERPERRRAGW